MRSLVQIRPTPSTLDRDRRGQFVERKFRRSRSLHTKRHYEAGIGKDEFLRLLDSDGADEVNSKMDWKVFGYNNHFHGFAIESSLKMLSMLGAASTDQQELLESVNEKLKARPTPR